MDTVKQLNSVTGDNRYCAPAAISTITGISTDKAAEVLNQVRGSDREVKSIYLKDLITALRNLGYEVYNVPEIKPKSTLYFTLSTIKLDGYYLITLPGHFVVIYKEGNKRFFCDNHTKTTIFAGQSARLMQKVVAIYRINKRNE